MTQEISIRIQQGKPDIIESMLQQETVLDTTGNDIMKCLQLVIATKGSLM